MTALRHLRSDTADKRPDPSALSSGQLAINYEAGSPGLFFKDTNGNLVKAGPVHIGTSAPNATPAAGGSTGNAKGEFWLDTTTGYDLKVWDGSAWRSAAGEYVNITGDTMTGDLVLDNANLVFEGATPDSFETTLTVVDPTADRTITLPNVSGTVVTTGDTGTVTSTMIANATIVSGDIANDTIVNANISASAEIAVSKLADGTARQLLQTDAAGTGVEWTSNVDVPGTLDVTGAATFDSTLGVTGAATLSSTLGVTGAATFTDDLIVNTNTLFVDASANAVGIGTSTVDFSQFGSNTGGVAIADVGATNTGLKISDGSYHNYLVQAGNGNFYISHYGAGDTVFSNGASGEEAFRVDASRRLLVGTSTARSDFFNSTYTPQFQLASAGNGEKSSIALISAGNGAYNEPNFIIAKSRGNAIGDDTAVQSGDFIGSIQFQGSDGTEFVGAASITALVDGTPGANDMPGRLVFSTTADGASSPTQAMSLHQDKRFYLSSAWYNNITTSSSANVHAISNGEFYRSTSSIKYKTDIETLQDSYADAILNVRPVWYRSTCQDDNSAHSWWGFIAEEVATIDPRLVQWKTKEVVYDDNGSPVETPCDPEPEGVAYDRFVPHLLNLIKRQKEQIEAMEARLSAFEAS